MNKWFVAAGIVGIFTILFVIGMFVLVADVHAKVLAWEDQQVEVSSLQKVAFSVAELWVRYWWALAPIVILLGFAAAALLVNCGRNQRQMKVAN